MNSVHIAAVCFTLFFYAILGCSFFGWGKVTFWAIGVTDNEKGLEKNPETFSIWIGWACALFIFNLLHFFFPLTIFTVTPVFVAGIIFSFVFCDWKIIKNYPSKMGLLQYGKIFIFFLIVLWVASRSMIIPSNYDSNLYHFNAVRWINSFPVIPGLGNLHGRLAFNQSFFTYVAALNLYPFFDQGRSIANSFLVALMFLTLIELLLPMATSTSRLYSPYLSALFCLPVVIFLTVSSSDLDSPSPDLSSAIIQIVIFVIFTRMIHSFVDQKKISVNMSVLLSILSSTAVTVKLSNLIFSSVVIILISGLLFFSSCQNRRRDFSKFIFPSIFVILFWYLHGIILSGYPLYPSTFGGIQTEWTIPVDQVTDLANWVYSWARQPGTHWKNVLGSWNWFDSWKESIVQHHFMDVIFPLSIFLLTVIGTATAILFSVWKGKKIHYIELIVIAPLIAGLIFWFLTAPDPRFANAIFMLLPVAGHVAFLNQIKQISSRNIFIAAICIFLAAECFGITYFFYQNQWMLLRVSLNGWQNDAKPKLAEKVTKYGLRVFTPLPLPGIDQCFDAPLPCTPYFNEKLRLRRSGDLSSGFVQDTIN